MITIPLLLGIIGVSLSIYALWVEKKIEQDHTYKPACDLSDAISCSKVANSPYAKLFQFSNSIWGIFFYTAIITCALLNYTYPLFLLSALGVIASCGLAFILYTKIKSVCLVCTSLYIVNILLLLTSYQSL